MLFILPLLASGHLIVKKVDKGTWGLKTKLIGVKSGLIS